VCTHSKKESTRQSNNFFLFSTQNFFYYVLTPKFGKESDLWDQLGEKIRPVEVRFLQMHSAENSAVGYLLPFGKETVELILRDCTVTWPKRKGRMDG
jgi:hypothetical protein